MQFFNSINLTSLNVFTDSELYQVPRSTTSSQHGEDDLFNNEQRMKIPQEWKRLQITNEYFSKRHLIKTSSIRETLSNDSGVSSPALSRDSSYHNPETDLDYPDSKRSTPDSDRKSLDYSGDDHEQQSSKKKGWFTKRRNKKKIKQMSEDETSGSNTLPAVAARMNFEKMKRYSVDALSFLDNPDTPPRSPLVNDLTTATLQRHSKGKRQSEGDINFNSKHQQSNLLHANYPSHKSEDGVEMSLC